MGSRFEVVVGRIETLAVDAVVNAANRFLRPGSGVDGALRRAAGPELTRHTERLGPIETGGAVITPGFDLPARFILHTAAPVFDALDDANLLEEGLARCYLSTLALAGRRQLQSIAYPCLGTGVYGWPKDAACRIALDACARGIAAAPSLERIVFCCFTEADAAPYRARLD